MTDLGYVYRFPDRLRAMIDLDAEELAERKIACKNNAHLQHCTLYFPVLHVVERNCDFVHAVIDGHNWRPATTDELGKRNAASGSAP